MASTKPLISMVQVNDLDYESFITVFGNVIEHCALAAAAVWRHRPYRDVNHLHDYITTFAKALPLEGQEGILRLHPDLAGHLADAGQLTSESTNEQRTAGLDSITADEKQKLKSLNDKYRDKFGFPFVICARQNKKEAILNGLEQRLQNKCELEVKTGLEEVLKICYLRLRDIVECADIDSKL
ncbi:unnamed protein product [Meganyctiphanes norvegica]|uniref:2-oxo-4-hydroxy-4-carboxy-5-ureidoimidazoline decarboxylase n=1 Tax=Meganyctiphanes norvegica TaxID=48144 RepID=A0AAV2RPW3_MEGNR